MVSWICASFGSQLQEKVGGTLRVYDLDDLGVGYLPEGQGRAPRGDLTALLRLLGA